MTTAFSAVSCQLLTLPLSLFLLLSVDDGVLIVSTLSVALSLLATFLVAVASVNVKK